MSVVHPLISQFLRVFFTFPIFSASSLRAIANSFNFKRATSNKPDDDRTTRSNVIDELATHSVPYSSIPESSQSDMPQTDHFKFSTPDSTMDEHLPGHPGHSSISALATAPASSTTFPPKTTIRLVSALNSVSALSPEPGTPQLRPVEPPFDLVMGSPDAQGKSGVPVWPLSPQPKPSERLYPVLPVDELEEAKQSQPTSRLLGTGGTASSQPPVSSAKVYPKPSNNVQDLFSPAPKLPSKQERVAIPRSEPFLFGSPLPRHSVSNKAFDATAASVLEEMNKRLAAAGVQKVGTDVFGTIPAATATTNADSGSLRASGTLDRFDKVHKEQFNKMDSIMNHYAARRAAPGSKKRKSDVLGNGSAPARNRLSTAPRKKMGIPGGFDDEEMSDDVQEEEDRRMSKRVRVLENDGGKDKGRRLTLLSNKTEAEEKQGDRERVATRKMLEARKEKRRSSRHARTSLAGPQAVSSTFLHFFRPMVGGPLTKHHADKGKATPRFGVFSAAKSIVRTVWNFGVGSPTKASRTSTATTKSKPATTGVTESKETEPAPLKKPSLAPLRPSEALASRKSIAPVRTASTSGKASSSQVRLPYLSSNTGGKSLNPGSTSSRQSVRASSANATTSNSTTGTAAGTSSGNRSNNKASIFSPSRAASRLFAPTASSLAKMQMRTAAVPGPASVKKSKTSAIVAQRAKTPPRNAAVLDAITNSPHGGNVSPSPGKIFTTPLLMLSPKQAVIPPPVKPTSLAAAATALASTTTTDTNTARKGTQKVSSFASASTTTRRAPASPLSTATKPTPQSATRKPRISRSRIVAKVGAQRIAAIATTKTGSTANPSASLSRSAAGSRIPRASGSAVRSPRVRSSMGTATRRSYAGAKSASRGSDVLMSAKKHARQSEYVRRRSRFTGSTVGAGVLGGASDTGDGGADGSMAMEVDDD